jgi:MFS family permease
VDRDVGPASRALFAAVALGSTAFVASITVTPLVGEDITRSATLSGFPWAAGVLGTGLGSVTLSQLMARRGRGPGLLLGYAAGVLGCVLAIVGTATETFLLFVVAVLIMGIGNSATHLSRYAAADLYPADRRASGLSKVVWAGAIGGVAGPALLDPSGHVAMRFGLPHLAGPFVFATVGCTLAMLVIGAAMLRDRGSFRPYEEQIVATGRPIFELWRLPTARVALIALAVAQVVMVMIMAMTPLHMRSTGHGLSSVGIVISVHVLGMYGLSPISGRLADRFGPVTMILAGFATLAAAAIGAAVAPHTAGVWLTIPLFLLGFGWSITFVSGSALLTFGLSYADRVRLQGGTDSVVWTAAAVAGLSSGILVEAFGYALLCVVGALLIAGPVLTIASRRRSLVLV